MNLQIDSFSLALWARTSLAAVRVWLSSARSSSRWVEEVLANLAGATAAFLTAVYGQARYLELLITLRADVELRNDMGRNPLAAACMWGHGAAVEVLLCARADVRGRDRWGMSALDWCERRGYADLSAILLAAGALPTATARFCCRATAVDVDMGIVAAGDGSVGFFEIPEIADYVVADSARPQGGLWHSTTIEL